MRLFSLSRSTGNGKATLWVPFTSPPNAIVPSTAPYISESAR